MNYSFSHIACILFNVLFISVLGPATLVSQIEIDAGTNAGVCAGGSLELAELNAQITGDVTDGTWLSGGDGVFLPQNTGIGSFSASTQYVPGPLDQQIGTVTLTLASDPHPVTGIIETDQVTVLVLESVPLACNDFVSVGLNADCEVILTPQYLINNASDALNLYEVELYTESGLLIPTDTIGIQFLDQFINFTVQETCDGNVCWGQILVMDNLAPQLNCQDTVLSCSENILPDSLGFPVVFDSLVPGPNNTYLLINGDNCGDAIASYADEEIEQACHEEYQLIIDRTWTVQDTSDNIAQCVQRIFLEKLDLFDVEFPDNHDGNELAVLDCSVSYPVDSIGNPLPEYTGMPNTTGCYYLHATYEDVNYNSCGDTKKILRNWNVIEWCTSQIRTESQLIEIADTLGPEIVCLDSLELAVNPYQCNIINESVAVPMVFDNCSDWSLDAVIRKDGIQIQYFSNLSHYLDLPELGMGSYTIHWMAEDACDNESECITKLEIVDLSAPFAICIDVTTVSVGNSGGGRLFPNSIDNESIDNCTNLSFRLRKITDACFNNTEFGLFVDFCCEEIGSTVMVEMEVSDENGLVNYCMTEVLVEDKAAPTLYCPTDLTVSCSYFNSVSDYEVFGTVQSDITEVEDIVIFDSYNNGAVGTDGYFQDNCGASITSSDVLELECSSGTLTRTFTAIDGSNNVDSCTQTITIVNEGNFTEDDIIWPSDFEYVACDTAFLDPSISGDASWALEDCSLVSSTYEDEVFVFSDNACVKIVRTWSVIDWCQYDAMTGNGLWTEEQVIKINNLTAPEFINCTDSIFHCITEDNCFQNFDFSILAFDDCTATDDLEFYFTLDLEADGSVEYSGFNANFTYSLPVGIHSVQWRVEDRCGNPVFCNQVVKVSDCKKPTPYCLGSLTMVLDEAGTAEVWASEYNLGGTDNCTSMGDLIVSFEEDNYVPVLEFGCGDIANGISETIFLDLWYIDESQNAEFCTVELILQDNQDACPDVISNDMIEGVVQDSKNENIPNLTIDLDCEVASFSQSTESPDGNYVFENLGSSLNYSIFCEKEDTYLNGVTTLDLLLIQRHILGLTLLPTGYDVLAADVNLSGKVTGIDIVDMRKLILGKTETLSITSDPWVFVKRDDAMAEMDPWGLEENIDIFLTEGSVEQNIVGIKYGDVNSSVTLQGDLESELRTQNLEVEWSRTFENGRWKYVFNLLEETNISAIQFSLNKSSEITNNQLVSNLNGFNDANFYVSDKSIRFSWNTETLEGDKTKDVLFAFESNEKFSPSLDMAFNNVLYTEDAVYNLEFKEKEIGQESQEMHLSLIDNRTLIIRSDHFEDGPLHVEIYDLSGKRLWATERKIIAGQNRLELDCSAIAFTGLYSVRAYNKAATVSKLLLLGAE